jgi:hypothetical protein
MDKLTAKIAKLNKIYGSMRVNYLELISMFKNHPVIKQKILLSEEMLQEAYMSILDKIETLTTNREFLKIIKQIKKKK